MNGRRTDFRSEWTKDTEPQVGDYWKLPDGKWGGVTPNGHHCNLTNHTVIENSDGTITVSPSIRVTGRDGQELWHGFLENGFWRIS